MTPVNFRDPAVIADPYPALRGLVAEQPIHWNLSISGWCLTRYDDVTRALTDARFSARRLQPFLAHQGETVSDAVALLGECIGLWMVFNDGDTHSRLRKLTNKAFTRRAVEALRPRIAGIVNELIDGLKDRESFDFVADFAYPLPARVIADMLGVPPEDIDDLKRWSDGLAQFVLASRINPDKYETAAANLAEMNAYFERLIAARRKTPGDKIIDALIAAHDGDDLLSLPETVATCVLLLFAGHETTTHFLANGLRGLLVQPEALAEFRARRQDAALAANAQEELMRWDGPSFSVVRVLAEDAEFAGHDLSRGQRVFLFTAAANRDPDNFPEPDRIDLGRANARRQITFGHGVHLCLGANLARLEGLVAFPALLDRLSGIRLIDDQPAWLDTLLIRGMKELNLAAEIS